MKSSHALLAVVAIASCAPAGHHKLSVFGLPPGAPPVTADAKTLTAQELRACIEERKVAQQGGPEAQAAKDATAQKQAALQARQTELQNGKPPPGSPRSVVLAYNAKVNAMNADNAAYSNEVKATNAKIEAVNKATAAFNTDCGGRKYYDDDAEAILKDYPGVTL